MYMHCKSPAFEKLCLQLEVGWYGHSFILPQVYTCTLWLRIHSGTYKSNDMRILGLRVWRDHVCWPFRPFNHNLILWVTLNAASTCIFFIPHSVTFTCCLFFGWMKGMLCICCWMRRRLQKQDKYAQILFKQFFTSHLSAQFFSDCQWTFQKSFWIREHPSRQFCVYVAFYSVVYFCIWWVRNYAIPDVSLESLKKVLSDWTQTVDNCWNVHNVPN